jgi:hypothetical protein
MGKTGESGSVEIDGQGLIAGTKCINTHVEFAAAEKQWVEKVSLADILFDGGVSG